MLCNANGRPVPLLVACLLLINGSCQNAVGPRLIPRTSETSVLLLLERRTLFASPKQQHNRSQSSIKVGIACHDVRSPFRSAFCYSPTGSFSVARLGG